MRAFAPAPKARPQPAVGFLTLLRSETRGLHDRAEAHVESAADRLDPAAYSRLLIVLLALHSRIERDLQSFAGWSSLEPPLDIVSRCRSHLLVADLDALGIDAPASREREAATPRLDTFGHALGALYVVEGSRLGGHVLAGRIERSPRAIDASAFRFLRSDGADIGRSWRELRAALEGFATSRETRQRVVRGAVETFACFERQLGCWAS
jgi:heme oxygenase